MTISPSISFGYFLSRAFIRGRRNSDIYVTALAVVLTLV